MPRSARLDGAFGLTQGTDVKVGGDIQDDARPLSFGLKFWYGVGQLAEGVKNTAFSFFLVFYSAAAVGYRIVVGHQAGRKTTTLRNPGAMVD